MLDMVTLTVMNFFELAIILCSENIQGYFDHGQFKLAITTERYFVEGQPSQTKLSVEGHDRFIVQRSLYVKTCRYYHLTVCFLLVAACRLMWNIKGDLLLWSYVVGKVEWLIRFERCRTSNNSQSLLVDCSPPGRIVRLVETSLCGDRVTTVIRLMRPRKDVISFTRHRNRRWPATRQLIERLWSRSFLGQLCPVVNG